jgi:hypothetical protein
MKTLIVTSDQHCNSTVGLVSPKADLDDGGSYVYSRGQRWLWANWMRFCDHIAKLENQIIILNGDLCEADAAKRSHQLITRNRATIKSLAIETISPLIENHNIIGIYILRGTESHTGKSAHMEELIADDLDDAIPCPETKTKSWWSLSLQVEQVKISLAHDGGGMSGIPWNRPAASNNLASRAFFMACQNREAPPDLVIRSHIHRWGDSYDAFPVRAIFTPAWTLKSSYINKLSPDGLAEIGALIIHVDGNRYEVQKWKAEPAKRVWQKI